MGCLPELNRAGLFLGKLPKPELPLAIEPAKEPLEKSSLILESETAATSSVGTVDTGLCFNDGDGLKLFKID